MYFGPPKPRILLILTVLDGMENFPMVSIIIPLWKHEKFLKTAIESIFNQNYKNIEIVLVNNNATKNVIDLASEVIHLNKGVPIRIVTEVVQGIASARSRGVIESQGDFVAFLDSDDFMYNNRVSEQVNVFKENPNASMIVCQYDFVSNDGENILKRGWTPRPEPWASLLLGKGFDPGTPFYDSHPSTMLFPRQMALKAGLFDTRFNPFWYEDSEFSLKMHFLGPIICIDKPLVAIRETSSEYRKTREGTVDWVRFVNTQIFFDVLRKRFSLLSQENKNLFSRIKSRWLLEQSRTYFNSKNGEMLGRRMILRGLKEFPFSVKNVNYVSDLLFSHQGNKIGPEIPPEFNSIKFVDNYLE